MLGYQKVNVLVGQRLSEIQIIHEEPAKKNWVPACFWGLIGFTGGYLLAALVAAKHWGHLP